MPMEVIFTDEDLEPVPEAAKFKPESPRSQAHLLLMRRKPQ